MVQEMQMGLALPRLWLSESCTALAVVVAVVLAAVPIAALVLPRLRSSESCTALVLVVAVVLAVTSVWSRQPSSLWCTALVVVPAAVPIAAPVAQDIQNHHCMPLSNQLCTDRHYHCQDNCHTTRHLPKHSSNIWRLMVQEMEMGLGLGLVSAMVLALVLASALRCIGRLRA